MIAFVLAVFLLLVTPGPGVLSTAGVGAARCRAGLFLLGLFKKGYVLSPEKTFVEYAPNWVPN